MSAAQQRYLIDKTVEFLKFCCTIGLLCFLTIKAPSELAQIVSAAAAFVLGGTKVRSKFGI
jgi:hypothetical protein